MDKILSKNNFVLEVLISTMNRTSLFFLKKMFPNDALEDLNLLIINQTKKGAECESKFDNIRVINSYETGLSKSRNLALKNAIGDICLIADDDVEYIKEFQDIIKHTYQCNAKVSIVTFKIDTYTGKSYKTYPKGSKELFSRKDIKPTSSIEITFKREDVIKNNIIFNTLFGLGGCFTAGEEYLFLKDALDCNLSIYFENEYIVKHPLKRSTSNMASDDYISTLAATNYLDFKNFSYLILMKYMWYLLKNKKISIKDVFAKFQVGVMAINKYKKLTN